MRDARPTAARLAAALTLAIALSACTVVRVYGDDGGVSIDRTLGFASLSFADRGAPVLAEVRSLGVSRSPLGFQAGWSAQSIALIPTDCRVVFWIDEPSALASLRDEIRTVKNACVVAPNRGEAR